MIRRTLYDGAIVNQHEPLVSLTERGLLYGDGAFEVLRTYGGVLTDLENHLDRLWSSCDRIALAMPLGRRAMGEELRRSIEGLGDEELSLRVMVWRGSAPLGLVPSAGTSVHRAIIVSRLKVYPPAYYEEGVAAVTVTGTAAKGASALGGAKLANYLDNMCATAEGHAKSAHEAIFVGAYGELMEGATSTLFVVTGASVWTPPLSLGILAGVTRKRVFSILDEWGVEHGERLLFANDLYTAAEAFITSTNRGVMPVVRCDGLSIGDGRPGSLTLRLGSQLVAR